MKSFKGKVLRLTEIQSNLFNPNTKQQNESLKCKRVGISEGGIVLRVV